MNPTYCHLSRLKFSYYVVIFKFCLFIRFFFFLLSYPLVRPTSQEISSRLRGSEQKKKPTKIITNNNLCRNDEDYVDVYFIFIVFYLNLYNMYIYKYIFIHIHTHKYIIIGI